MQRWQCPIYNNTLYTDQIMIQNVDMVVFLTQNLFDFDILSILSFNQDIRKSLSHAEKPQMRINCLKKRNHLIYTWWDKGFKGTVVNRTWLSVHWGSLEITLTYPLNMVSKFYFYYRLQTLFRCIKRYFIS